MLRFCALVSLLVGAVAIFLSVSLGALGFGLSGGWSMGGEAFVETLVLFGPVICAGLLYAFSGVVLWKSLPVVTGTTIALQGIACVLCLAYCLRWFIELQGLFGVGGRVRQPGDPFDEEVVMMVFVPSAVLVLAAVQFAYLLKTWGRWHREEKASPQKNDIR